MNESIQPKNLELQQAQAKADQSSQRFANALEQVEGVIEDKTRIITDTAQSIQDKIEMPSRLMQSVKEKSLELSDQGMVYAKQAGEQLQAFYSQARVQAQPALDHLKRHQREYSIGAASFFIGGLVVFFFGGQRRPKTYSRY